MKTCPKCAMERPLDAFHRRPNGRLQSHCKVCSNARAAAWQKANRDRANEAFRRYQETNREKINERARQARAAKPDNARAAVAKWRAENAEAARAATRAWYYANPDRSRAIEAKRRAAKLQASVSWADEDLIEDLYTYARLMREAGVDCHVDHSIPLQGKRVCGLHTHDNLTVLLAKDNIAKGNRFTEV